MSAGLKQEYVAQNPNIFLETDVSFMDAQETLFDLMRENPDETVTATYIIDNFYAGLSSHDYSGKNAIEYPTVLLHWIQKTFSPGKKAPDNTYWFLNYLENQSLARHFDRLLFRLFELTPQDMGRVEETLESIESTYMEIMFTILPMISNLPEDQQPDIRIGEWSSHFLNFSLYKKGD